MSPNLKLVWGPYFRPDPTEQKLVVDMARAALSGEGGGLITKRHAIEKIAPIFGIENVDAVIGEILKEDEEAQKRSLDQEAVKADTLGAIAAKHAPAKPPKAGFPK